MNIKKDKLFLVLVLVLALSLMAIIIFLRPDYATEHQQILDEEPTQNDAASPPTQGTPEYDAFPPPEESRRIIPPALPY
jgi:hypothetical protein